MVFILHIVLIIVLLFFTQSNTITLNGSTDAGIFQEPFTLTCYTRQNPVFLTWINEAGANLAYIQGVHSNGSCKFSGAPADNYMFSCDSYSGVFNMTISGPLMTNSFHKTRFKCEASINNMYEQSEFYTLYINIPVSVVTLISLPNDENPVKVNETITKTFYCETNAIRPSAVINWFLATENITDRGTTTIMNGGSDLFVSSSDMNYTGVRNDSNKILYCTASNIANRIAIPSVNKILQINYGPNEVKLTPSTPFYTVNETADGVGPITCSAECVPNCTITWTGPNIPAGTTSELKLQNIKRNQSGYYQCTGSNIVGKKMSIIIRVIVQYGPDTVVLAPSTSFYTVNETADSIGPINCTADCMPNCSTIWYGPNLPDGTSSVLLLQKIRKNQTGNYQCIASNIVSSKSTFIVAIVQYGPSEVKLRPSISFYTVNETADSVDPITCSAECVPNCTMTWTGPNIPAGTTSELKLQNIQRNQSGDYQCTASNIVSSKMSIFISVLVQYGPTKVKLSPSNESYTVNETANAGPISCIADCMPNCTILWSGPKRPVGATSELNLQHITRNQTGDYQCTASNIVSSMKSIIIRVIVQYGPDTVVLAPSTSFYTVNETADSIGPINCTADCMPKCAMRWSGPNISINTTSALNVQNIKRDQSGEYQCTASNVVGKILSTKIRVIVQYRPYITRLSGNFTADENDTVVMECMVNSLPDSTIEWIFNSTSIQAQTDFHTVLLGNSTSVQSSKLIINRTECLLMGSYSCHAFNILGSVFSVTDLIVNCEPRVNTIEFNVPTTIPIGDLQPINVTIQIISYPAPTIYWTFKADNASSVNVTTNITNDFGINRHTSNLFIDNPDNKNFGQYIIYAYNLAGRVHNIHSFNVIPERKPDSPGDVICEENLNYVIMHWISGFNGGRQQNFSVYYSEHVVGIAADMKESGIIADKGQGKNITAKIYPLFPGKSYLFKVIARNIQGYSESEEIVCNTTGETLNNEQTNNPTVLAAALGVSSATIVLLTVVVVIFLVKRRDKRENDKENNKRANRKDEDDDDGLIDNILYQSVGSNFECQSATSGDVYAVVEKKGHQVQIAREKIQETSLSKRMQMSGKKNNKGGLYADVSDTEELKRNGKQRKHEDVYENTESTERNNHYNPRKENRNKDGLQYADLVFNPSPDGAKFIIRGLDDRIIYADIDTTKKTDPLPENDVDEEANTRTVLKINSEDQNME